MASAQSIGLAMGLMPNAEELGTLKEQGDAEAKKQKALEEHHKHFDELEQALGRGELKRGLRMRDVGKRFGHPDAVDRTDAGERWLYRRTDKKKWLEVPYVWLSFNADERLEKIECMRIDCGPSW